MPEFLQSQAWQGFGGHHQSLRPRRRPTLAHQKRRDKMAVFASDQTHTIIKKACRILGLHYFEVPAKLENNWAIDVNDMERAILKSLEEK